MPESYFLEAGFPVKGQAAIAPFADQEVGTSADMVNLLPFDSGHRLRGGSRPGLSKWCPNLVFSNGTSSPLGMFSGLGMFSPLGMFSGLGHWLGGGPGASAGAVQCIAPISATYVDPILGDGTAVYAGSATSANYFSLVDPAGGTPVGGSTTYTFLAACFGPDDYVYVVEYSGTAIRLSKHAKTGGAAVFTTALFTASTAVAAKHLCGIECDEDTVYIWYLKINNIGEGVVRLSQATGANLDSSTGGVWLRAEADATHTEKVFGGVGNAGWDVLGSCGGSTVSHPSMRIYAGKMAIPGAPLKSGGTATEHELVLYVVDTKTGIVDAVHDLGLDGTSTSTDAGKFVDLAFGLDGYIYTLTKDHTVAGNDGKSYIRRITTAGVGIWEIETSTTTDRLRSIAWNNDRRMLVICGDAILGTASSLVVIDPESKGIVDYSSPGSTNWNLVRCDDSGNYYLWQDSGPLLRKYDSSFAQVWTKTPATSLQTGCAINSYFNAGTDEAGSTRYQSVVGVAGGSVSVIAESGTTSVTNSTGSSTVFSPSVSQVFSVPFGVLTFFADGVHNRYYDAVTNTVYDWTTKVTYGALPANFSQIEVWNRRLILFGISRDPSNWYAGFKGDPFDWKLQPNVESAAISGRLSPAGLYPEKINAVIPFDDSLCLFGGDHSIYQLSRDPAVDARFDIVSDTIGIAPGRAWCKDGQGSVYFFGNSGGIYKVGLNAPPQRITRQSIDKKLDDVDVANSTITMAYDTLRRGIWLFIRPIAGTAADCYWFDFDTEGWFPIRFGNADFNPLATAVFDQDNPRDQRILLGMNDGYVRTFDPDETTDDGYAFTREFTIGPWLPREGIGYRMSIEGMQVMCGNNSVLKAEVLGGDDAESVISSGRVLHTSRSQLGCNLHRPKVSAQAIAIRFSTEFDKFPEFEGVRMQAKDLRRIV